MRFMTRSLLSLTLLSYDVLRVCALPTSANTPPAFAHFLDRRDPDDYAPDRATCATSPPTRPASGIGSAESTYISGRASKAADALKAWLSKTDPTFGQPSTYPTLGLASSGGGLRATLTGAGVIQALDGRDSQTSVSGLYQALTYQAGLSGGSWLLGSIAASNWATISSLQSALYEPNFQEGLLFPDGLGAFANDRDIVASLRAKNDAGFPPTLVDAWGRLQGLALFEQPEGGIDVTWSGVAQGSNFVSQDVPFPIITAIGVNGAAGQCIPVDSSPQYEFTPFEFGSWDAGVASFVPMHSIGSRAGECVTGYDKLSYVTGTSSNLLNQAFSALPGDSTERLQDFLNDIAEIKNEDNPNAVCQNFLAPYPNPFQDQPDDVYLVDGGETLQNNPIWPFLHRDVDVLIVNDNSDDAGGFPNGTEIHQTFLQAQAQGLTRMPEVPDENEYIARGLQSKPTFFGCDDDNVLTIIFVPNVAFTYPSGTSTFKLQYNEDETQGMIKNGNAVATFNGNSSWAECMGCAVMKKAGTDLPDACEQCFTEFCFRP